MVCLWRLTKLLFDVHFILFCRWSSPSVRRVPEPKYRRACLRQRSSGHYLCLVWRLKTSCQISHFTHWKHEMWLKTFHISHNRLAFGPAVARCRLCHSRTVTKVKTSLFVNANLLNIPNLTSGWNGSKVKYVLWCGRSHVLFAISFVAHLPPSRTTLLRMSRCKPPPYYWRWSRKYEYFSKLQIEDVRSILF